MGRRKIQMKYQKDAKRRKVTHKKRSQGLLKKALELTVLTNCDVTIMINDHDKQTHVIQSSLSNEPTDILETLKNKLDTIANGNKSIIIPDNKYDIWTKCMKNNIVNTDKIMESSIFSNELFNISNLRIRASDDDYDVERDHHLDDHDVERDHHLDDYNSILDDIFYEEISASFTDSNNIF